MFKGHYFKVTVTAFETIESYTLFPLFEAVTVQFIPVVPKIRSRRVEADPVILQFAPLLGSTVKTGFE